MSRLPTFKLKEIDYLLKCVVESTTETNPMKTMPPGVLTFTDLTFTEFKNDILNKLAKYEKILINKKI